MAERPETPRYPVFLELDGRLAVVLGAGPAIERRVTTLLRYGADITVISPDAGDALRALEAEGRITIEPRGYVRGDLEGAFIVFCAADSEVAAAVVAEAESRGCLVNVADDPERCNFLVPSTVRRGSLQLAVSTGGIAPALAKRLRARLREEFGEEWAAYLAVLTDLRLAALSAGLGAAQVAETVAAADASDLFDRVAGGERPDTSALLAAFAPHPDASAGDAVAEAVSEPRPEESA